MVHKTKIVERTVCITVDNEDIEKAIEELKGCKGETVALERILGSVVSEYETDEVEV